MGIASDKTRIILHNGSTLDSADDEVTVTKLAAGGFTVETYERWAGDSEHGFGARASVTITEQQANALWKWLKQPGEIR